MANDKEFLEFDLYLDESGNFLETSNVPAERNHPDAQQDFPSQIAGFLVPRHDIKAEARTIFERCAEAAYGQTNIRKTRTGTMRRRNPLPSFNCNPDKALDVRQKKDRIWHYIAFASQRCQNSTIKM